MNVDYKLLWCVTTIPLTKTYMTESGCLLMGLPSNKDNNGRNRLHKYLSYFFLEPTVFHSAFGKVIARGQA